MRLDAGIGVGRGTKKRGVAAAFFNSNCRTAYACGCGSSPASGSGRGRGLPAGGTAEARGVVGSITDSRFGCLPFEQVLDLVAGQRLEFEQALGQRFEIGALLGRGSGAPRRSLPRPAA